MSMIEGCHFVYIFFVLIVCFSIKFKQLNAEIAKQKEYFIKTLGHDFRVSVIAQIRGLEIIQKTIGLYPEQSFLINEINNSCKYTLDMINMLIKIYGLENNDIKLKYENINIYKTLNEIFGEYIQELNDKNITINYNIKNMFVNADKEYLKKAIKILIFTAIQHTKQNTSLIVSAFEHGKDSKFEIQYFGNPLSEEELNRMNASNTNFSTVGYGIQMYLFKKIIDLHKGKFTTSSKQNNENTFEIAIPT